MRCLVTGALAACLLATAACGPPAAVVDDNGENPVVAGGPQGFNMEFGEQDGKGSFSVDPDNGKVRWKINPPAGKGGGPTSGTMEFDPRTGTVRSNVKTPQGEKQGVSTFGPAAKLPSDWPRDVVIYPGSEVLLSSSNGGNHSIHLQTSDPFAKVVAFYKEKMSTGGWSIKSQSDRKPFIVIRSEKDGRTLFVQLIEQPGQTRVIVNHSKKK